MCKKCIALVKKFYPDLPESDYGDLLMSATAFPFGGPEIIEEQLRELREKTDGSLWGAIAFANQELLKQAKP